MSRRLPMLVAIAATAQAGIALLSYLAIRGAERSGWPVFSAMVRELVFVDVTLYFDYANCAFAGKVPYRDFAVEYPPLALPFFLAPRSLTPVYYRYIALFAGMMLAIHSATLWAVARRVARVEGPAAVPRRLLWITAAYVGFAPFVMGRFDAVPAFFAFVAASLLYGGRPATGGMLAGLGTLVKIVPGAVALPALVSDVFARPERRRRGTLGWVATVAAGVVVWSWFGGAGGVVNSIRYHSGRGIEVGSIASGVLGLRARLLGLPVETIYGHASTNLVTAGTPAASRFALPIQAALMAVVAARYLRAGRRDPFRFAGAAVLAFAIGGKVLSPQYLIWIWPFAASLTGRPGGVGRPLFLAASLMTMALYPWSFGALVRMEVGALCLLNARNLALVGLLVAMLGPEGPAPVPNCERPGAHG